MNKYLLGLIVVIILYIVYSYFFKDHTSANLVGMHNAKNEVRVEATSLPGNSVSADFTFSIWVYINDWNYRYGYTKPVFYRGDKTGTNNKSPQVNFGSNTNDDDRVKDDLNCNNIDANAFSIQLHHIYLLKLAEEVSWN